MDPRALAGLTAVALLLMQLHLYLLPGARAVLDPFSSAAQRQMERSAELRRRGIDLAALAPGVVAIPATVVGEILSLETVLPRVVASP